MQALELARANAKEIKAAYRRACASRDLVKPVAARKFREETRKVDLLQWTVTKCDAMHIAVHVAVHIKV